MVDTSEHKSIMHGRLLSDGAEGRKTTTVDQVLGRTLWEGPQKKQQRHQKIAYILRFYL